MQSDTLYTQIRLDFFRNVYSGEIEPYQQLIPERKEAEALSVSRGTIRKARKLLEEEGYISNTQGSGAIYTPLETRKSGTPDIIAVLVPVHNPFFISFYRAFESEAEKHGILVVIKQLDNHNAEGLKDVLFSLFLKGIRDIVFWPYDTLLDYRHIERLSGLGMNVVFFDSILDYDFTASVSVDNHHAITSLYAYLKKRGTEKIVYLGWGNSSMSSSREREESFQRVRSAEDRVITLPWDQEALRENQLEHIDINAMIQHGEADGFLCGNGHIGVVLKSYLIRLGHTDIPVCTIDNFTESEALGLTAYDQPFQALGQQTFGQLQKRFSGKRSKEAETHYVKGEVIER